MKVKTYFKKLWALVAAAAMVSAWLVVPTIASSGRDCDSNALVYCGALSTTELSNKLRNGTGKPYQTAGELQTLYGHYGFAMSDIGSLREGWVTKENIVYVNGRGAVANNVYSLGRHDLSGSIRESWAPYPLYSRHPSVSFNSYSLDAWVYLNSDGSMAYAIIKSCGNIVKGVGKREIFNGFALKFNDLDGDGNWDAGEPRMAGVRFNLTGNGQSRTNVTREDGYAGFWDLPRGTYTVTEVVPAGWRSTTGAVKTLNLQADRTFVTFGNTLITHTLRIHKYIDNNLSGTYNTGEPDQGNVSFRVTGPNGFNRTAVTDNNGWIVMSGLVPGSYTVTETVPEGYRATTQNPRTFNLNQDTRVDFGNARIVIPREEVRIRIVKFNDANNNQTEDGTETRLSGWEFRVTGPNGFNRTVATGANGESVITGLEPGIYTVTEINRNGWINTTGLTVQRTVTVDSSTQLFVFGNRQEEVPPVTPPGGGEVTPLPTSGPAETAAVTFASMTLSGGTLAWIRSKKLLAKALLK